MGSEKNVDDLLCSLLFSEGSIVGFFDRIFEFLYRRTDFFKLKSEESSGLGLMPGEAEKIVKCTFCKYMEQAVSDQESQIDNHDSPGVDIAEEVVTTSEQEITKSMPASSLNSEEVDSPRLEKEDGKIDDQSEPKLRVMDPDCYNGAHYERYTWAQTLKDIDLRVQVPTSIISGKQVRVSIESRHLCIETMHDDQWKVLKAGDFLWKVNVEDSTWTLVPGEHIHVCFQKMEEKFWDAFFVDEPKIDLKDIDPTIAYEDLDQESKAKIEELMYNEHLKRLGKPTIQQNKAHNILKEAWDADGSPFKGRPFDPSILDVQNADPII